MKYDDAFNLYEEFYKALLNFQMKARQCLSSGIYESDANLEFDKLTSYVPGVTHLGKKFQKSSRMKSQKSTQSSSRHPKGDMTTAKVGHDGKGQGVSQHEDTVSLKNLRPQDKKRIANLIKELAKVGEEKEVAMQQLTVERKEFEVKYINLQTQMNSMKKDRESLQHQYLQCQKLLLECQKRLGKEQAKHQQYLKSGQAHERQPMHNKNLQDESKLQNQYYDPVVQNRTEGQFQPQMQSTLRGLKGPEYFTHPMNNQDLPPNQPAVAPQTSNIHEMVSNNNHQHGHQAPAYRFSSLGKKGPHQGHFKAPHHFQEPDSRSGKIFSKDKDMNPLSPSIFSPDEFHPLPEELINSRSFEAIEAGRFRSQSTSRGDYDPQRLETQTSGPFQRGFNEGEVQKTLNASKGEERLIPVGEGKNGHEYAQEETEILHKREREYPSNLNSANQHHPEYETDNSEWVRRGGEHQTSNHSFHSRKREDSLQREGPISEIMIQRQRQLEEQKMRLKREQDWLQKQLRDQEQLLYQKQMELEAHRESLLLEEDGLHSEPDRVGVLSEGHSRAFHDRSGTSQELAEDRHRERYGTIPSGQSVGNTTMRRERIPHKPLSTGVTGPNSHKKEFLQHGERDVTLDKGGSRKHAFIHGSVSLHEDSHHRKYPSDPTTNTTVDASTSPLQPPQRQIERKSIGLSPAIHHPHSHLMERSSSESSPVRSPDQFPIIADQSVQAIPVKDSQFLDDLIEELNSLPSDSSNETIIQPATPINTIPDSNKSGLTSYNKTHVKKSILSKSYSSRIFGSEIVSSTDDEEESQLLDDIFFLN